MQISTAKIHSVFVFKKAKTLIDNLYYQVFIKYALMFAVSQLWNVYATSVSQKWTVSLPSSRFDSQSTSVSLFPFEERPPKSTQIILGDEVSCWHCRETLGNDHDSKRKAWRE